MQITKTLISEVMVDIAINAGYLIASGEIEVEDSRILVQRIQRWAEEFVKRNSNPESYIGEVDEYASSLLKSNYPRPNRAFD